MALVALADRPFPRIDHLDRPVEQPRRQRSAGADDRRGVVLAAESAAERGADDLDVRKGEAEAGGDEAARAEGMLHAAADLDGAVGAGERDRHLGLHVGVLDELGAEGFFEHQIGLGKSAVHIPAADAVGVDDVAAVVYMDQGRLRLHRLLGIEQGGQLLGLDPHQGRAFQGLVPGFGHDHRDHIPMVADAVVGEDAEIPDDLAEAVRARHIAMSQHPHYPGAPFRLRRVDGGQHGMDVIGIDRHGMEHAGEFKVAGELGFAGHLGIAVVAPALFPYF